MTDRARFESLVVDTLDDLYRYALHLERDPVRAEDLLQGALTRALTRIHQLRDDHAFRAWTCRIIHRSWQRRRPSPNEVVVDPSSLDNVIPLSTNGPDRRAATAALSRSLADALDDLPEEHRDAVWLVDGLGFKYREVAEVLGIPPGTAASRVARGRMALRETLADIAREEGVTR